MVFVKFDITLLLYAEVMFAQNYRTLNREQRRPLSPRTCSVKALLYESAHFLVRRSSLHR
jgi:hypothetical protein